MLNTRVPSEYAKNFLYFHLPIFFRFLQRYKNTLKQQPLRRNKIRTMGYFTPNRIRTICVLHIYKNRRSASLAVQAAFSGGT